MNEKLISYWHWFIFGSGEKAGYRRILNKWILLHLLVGLLLSFLVQITLETAANAVLLPLAAIFVGLSFAWAGNAMVLLQSAEIDAMAEYHSGGFTEYVFTFQTAILTILFTLVFWGLAGLKLFDSRWPTTCNPKAYFLTKTILFALSSLTLRECWHVVMGAQWMLLVQRVIKRRSKQNKAEEN
jgi:hypothetical protein